MLRLISIISSNGVIGVNNKLPFSYQTDMNYFRRMTLNKTVIMGRNTFESLGKPLPKRRNIVISSKHTYERVPREDSGHFVVVRKPIELSGAEVFPSIRDALETILPPLPVCASLDKDGNLIKSVEPDVWFIGGAAIYEEAMGLVQEMHITITKDIITGDDLLIKFPWINLLKWEVTSREEDGLTFCIFTRK
jgi:dihydrofolate reductase